MRALAQVLLLVLLLVAPARAQSPDVPAAEHLLLIDVSGSMRKGGYVTSAAWPNTRFSQELQERLAALLAPGGPAFRASDALTILPFADPATEQKEGRQPVEGPTLADARQALAHLPGPWEGATDLRAALLRALERPPAQPLRFYWILTDNENNFQGQRSDRPFYELLRDDPRLGHVWFFPLAAPRDATGQPGREGERAGALVLYLATSPLPAGSRWLEDLVREVERRLGEAWGFPIQGVLFRPLYVDESQPVLDVGHDVKTDDGKTAQRAGSRFQVPLALRGGSLEGKLHFHFVSRLDGWEIAEATLKPPRLKAPVGSGARARLDRRSLSVLPRKATKDSYALTFVVPRPRGAAPAGPLAVDVEMEAEVRLSQNLESSGMRPAVDEATRSRMEQVEGLGEILNLMLHQSDAASSEGAESRVLRVLLPVDLVPPAGGGGFPWWIVLVLIVFLLVVGLLAAGRRYRLDGPDGEEDLRLGGLFRRHPLRSRRGELLGHLVPGPRVVPGEGVMVDGREGPARLRQEAAEFVLQPEGGGASRFRLEPAEPGRPRSHEEEGPAL